MCNCNSSFCAVCCRRVKAYRFDNVPEITGDLQLYTEFYKVGEAYGHWKFTIDDLEAYLDIPTVLWQDKLVAFGHTLTGGLFYQSDFRFDYTTSSLTVGTRGVGTEGLYSASFGNNIVGDSSLAVGDSNEIGASSIAVGSGNFGGSNNIFLFGDANGSSQRNATIFGDSNKSSQQKINIFGYKLTASHGGNAMFSDAIGGSSSIADNAFTAQFAGGYRFRLDASSTAVNISSTGIVNIDNVVNNNTENQLLVWNVSTKEVEYRDVSSLPGGGGGTVTSVGMTITGSTALAVSGSPITTSGTFAVTWTGNNTQYVAGDGSLITFPTLTSGTVTAVNSGAGMDFTNFTTSGTIILGTPSTITLASVNGASGTTHSHEFDLGGTAGQYLAGDNTLQTFPTIPTYTGGTGISVSGTVITNTLPSLWSRSGTVLSPITSGDSISLTSNSNSVIYNIAISNSNTGGSTATGINLGFGNLIQSYRNTGSDGYIQLLASSSVRLGILSTGSIFFVSDLGSYQLAYTSQYMDSRLAIHRGTADEALHVGGKVKIDTISTGSSSTNLLTTNSGVVETRTIDSLPFTNNTGTVTAVNSGAGMDFTNFTTSGTIILGTPSSITLSSTNAATGTTHSHALNLGGTSGQYLAGDNTLQTFPTIPTVTPSALTRTNDTNILLNLTGSNTTALLQAVDIEVAWSGLLSYTRGGTGLGSLGTANQILRVNALATSLEYFTPTWTSNTGTVTNFSTHDLTTFTDPLFTVNVTNSTTTPDLTFTLPTLTQKLVFAAPWGVSGQPFWRQLLPSDLSRDGATSGQVITWNGTAWVPQNAAGGGVTSVSAGNGMNFSTITSTGTITMGMPSSISLVSTNSTSTTSHTHAFVPGGTTSQVILGNGSFGSYIPGLWQRTGSEIKPLNANDTVRITTTSTGVQTLLTLANTSADVNRAVRIDLGAGGIIQSYPDAANSFIQFLGGTNGVRFGTIAGGTFMSLTDNGSYVLLNTSQFVDTRLAVHRGTADEALHVGGKVKIDTISTVSSSTNLLTTNGGVLETRTIASLTGLPSSVWYLQGGTTASTNTSQNIYRTGDVWLNTGSTGAGGYKFRVTGDSYFEAQQYFAYATYQVWRNSANNAWLNGIRYNTSNQLELGQSSFDIYLPGYTSSRSVDTKTLLDKTLFVNSSGVVKSESSEWVRNDGASCWITSTESHLADNTNRRVTFDSSASVFNTYYTFGYSSGDYKMFFPGSYSQHLVICTLEYTTSGTPTVTATLRRTSTVIETNISTSADGRKVMTIHAIMSGTSSDYPTLYIYNATGGAAITLQKCKITMIPLGETPP